MSSGTRLFSVFKTAQPKSKRKESSHLPDRNVSKDFLQKKGKSHSSTLWLDRQLRDPYYLQVFHSFSMIRSRQRTRDIVLEQCTN